jgi:hypothetical protein
MAVSKGDPFDSVVGSAIVLRRRDVHSYQLERALVRERPSPLEGTSGGIRAVVTY